MFTYTTPTHEFVMDINPVGWDSFIITYSQAGKIIFEKTEEDPFTIDDQTESGDGHYHLSIKLSQEETAMLTPNDNVYVQIRCKYDTGDTFASDKILLKVDDVLHKTVI